MSAQDEKRNNTASIMVNDAPARKDYKVKYREIKIPGYKGIQRVPPELCEKYVVINFEHFSNPSKPRWKKRWGLKKDVQWKPEVREPKKKAPKRTSVSLDV